MASREQLVELDRATGVISDASSTLGQLGGRAFAVATRIVAITCDARHLQPAGAPVDAAIAAAARLRELLAVRLPELQRELANLEAAIGELERAAPS